MTILWTIGDINGIGPEIILKAFSKLTKAQKSENTFVVVGSYQAMLFYRDILKIPVELTLIENIDELELLPEDDNTLPVLDVGTAAAPSPGKLSGSAGALAMEAIELATNLCLIGKADALVTAPIHKEAISKAGYPFHGHTDFIAHLCGAGHEQMMLCDPPSGLRVVLATIHIPIAKVPSQIRKNGVAKDVDALAKALQQDFGIKKPKIAVLGLNPHASDGGVMGNEEEAILKPQLKELRKRVQVDGPFASDGFFGTKSYLNYDAVLAMYHDQGLIPFKLLAFETGVNVTLGLPVVRTSPDHGTAFNIAGKGVANAKSFIAATELAIEIREARQKAASKKERN